MKKIGRMWTIVYTMGGRSQIFQMVTSAISPKMALKQLEKQEGVVDSAKVYEGGLPLPTYEVGFQN